MLVKKTVKDFMAATAWYQPNPPINYRTLALGFGRVFGLGKIEMMYLPNVTRETRRYKPMPSLKAWSFAVKYANVAELCIFQLDSMSDTYIIRRESTDLSTITHSQEGMKITTAINQIIKFGGFDGVHHKDWVLDQVMQTLAGPDLYKSIVDDANKNFPNTWNVGIEP